MPQGIQVHDVTLARMEVLDYARSAQNGVMLHADEMLVSIAMVFAQWKLEVLLFSELLHQIRG